MKMPGSQIRRARGVSLVEALVAVAAMGIGMFGIVGLQATLRANSDVAKQRSEAVRYAQEAIEEWRAITALDTTANRLAYEDLETKAAENIAGANATYSLTRTVVPMDTSAGVAEADTVPRAKSLRVTVSWVDRSGETQSVSLSTAIAGIMPELAATLAVPADGDPVRQPFGRHRGIPLEAKLLGKEYSGYKPPGAPATVAWRFDNVTALITLCTTDAALTNETLTTAALVCGADKAMLLSGYVRYATGLVQPGNEEPMSDPLPVQVWVDRTAPAALRYACYVQHVAAPSKYTAYRCAVPVVVLAAPAVTTWWGRTYFMPDVLFGAAPAAGFPDAPYKVCRYFPDDPDAADERVRVVNGSYEAVKRPVVNHNYLVIRAGNNCPVPPTVLIPHQLAAYPAP